MTLLETLTDWAQSFADRLNRIKTSETFETVSDFECNLYETLGSNPDLTDSQVQNPTVQLALQAWKGWQEDKIFHPFPVEERLRQAIA